MNNNKIYPIYFTFGMLFIYSIFVFLPGLIGIFYSFTDWNSFSDELNFIGLENYKTILKGDPIYLFYIGNTVKFTLLTTIIKTLIGFVLALVMINKNVRFRNIHRTIIFSPQVLSFLIVGLIFRSILHPSKGFLNTTLEAMNLGFLAKNWLGSIDWAFFSVIAVDIWKGVGYIMVVLIAGLNSIPQIYHEVAQIDGAGFFRRIIHITIPLLMPSITVVTVLNITYGLRVFDSIYVLTNGGPGYATGVVNTAVFKEFSKGRFGLGTAMSSLLFLFILLISYFLIKGLNKKAVEY
ncbi:MAG: sugar ABC transporter permease [Spirochaetales bacterium]|nr:sugar ABC transporter permease [Spirochaetales bacterium]